MPPCTVDPTASPTFSALVDRLGQTNRDIRADLEKLYVRVRQEYRVGDQIPRLGEELAGKVWKYRAMHSGQGRGTRGGYRVIGYYRAANATLYPILIYEKSEREDVDAATIRTAVEGLEAAIKDVEGGGEPRKAE